MSTKGENKQRIMPENYISSYSSLGFYTALVYTFTEKTTEWNGVTYKVMETIYSTRLRVNSQTVNRLQIQ